MGNNKARHGAAAASHKASEGWPYLDLVDLTDMRNAMSIS
jgi:hypothetical protein